MHDDIEVPGYVRLLVWVVNVDAVQAAAAAFESGAPPMEREVAVNHEHMFHDNVAVVHTESGGDGEEDAQYIVLRGLYSSFGTDRLLLVRLTPALVETGRPFQGTYCIDLPPQSTIPTDYPKVVDGMRHSAQVMARSGLDQG